MEQSVHHIADEIDILLKDGYHMWKTFGLDRLTAGEKHGAAIWAAISCKNGLFVKEFAAACQCFYLFRRLHRMVEQEPEKATLLGDYFFSQFSHYLIPIDNTRLIDLFSEYLKQDTKEAVDKSRAFDESGYLGFIRSTAEEIRL